MRSAGFLNRTRASSGSSPGGLSPNRDLLREAGAGSRPICLYYAQEDQACRRFADVLHLSAGQMDVLNGSRSVDFRRDLRDGRGGQRAARRPRARLDLADGSSSCFSGAGRCSCSASSANISGAASINSGAGPVISSRELRAANRRRTGAPQPAGHFFPPGSKRRVRRRRSRETRAALSQDLTILGASSASPGIAGPVEGTKRLRQTRFG